MLIEREKEPITTSMVKHNQTFTKDEVTKLVNLMNEYRLCFAFNIYELGCTNVLTMDIVDNDVPVVSRPSPQSGTSSTKFTANGKRQV